MGHVDVVFIVAKQLDLDREEKSHRAPIVRTWEIFLRCLEVELGRLCGIERTNGKTKVADYYYVLETGQLNNTYNSVF